MICFFVFVSGGSAAEATLEPEIATTTMDENFRVLSTIYTSVASVSAQPRG